MEPLHYCTEGFRLSGVLSKIHVFLLADLISPEFFVLNIDKNQYGKIHKIRTQKMLYITSLGHLQMDILR